MPLAALLTYAMYFPASPASAVAQEAGHEPALAADRPLAQFCHPDFTGFIRPAGHCEDLVALLLMVKLQEHTAPRTFLLKEATPDSFTDSVSMTLRAAALSEPWLGSSRAGKPARLWRCGSCLTHPAAAATGLGCSLTTFSSHNTAAPGRAIQLTS